MLKDIGPSSWCFAAEAAGNNRKHILYSHKPSGNSYLSTGYLMVKIVTYYAKIFLELSPQYGIIYKVGCVTVPIME